MLAVLAEELEGVVRAHRREHLRVAGDGPDAQEGEGREPDEHDWTEHRAHPRRAVALHQEQPQEDDDS